MAKDKRGVAVAAAALAAGAGYLVGILTAPKSGKETRKQILNETQLAKVEAEKKLKEIHGDINKVIDEAGLKAKSAKSAAKKELDTLVNDAKAAKTKAREVLSAVHEGGADDADLDKAIRHAKRAVKNLKDFLKTNDR